MAVAVARPASAEPPVASYIFPAGGQRGTTVAIRVGGLYLNDACDFDLLGDRRFRIEADRGHTHDLV